MKCTFLLFLAFTLQASMIELTTRNVTRPGFVAINIDGASYEAISYTDASVNGSSQGTWPAWVLTYEQLPDLGYFGPHGAGSYSRALTDAYWQPQYPDYLARYGQWNDLFVQMVAHPEAAVDIQEAIYWLANPLSPAFHANAWSDQAAFDVEHGLQPDASRFRYINSPFILEEKRAYMTWDRRAGLIIDLATEPVGAHAPEPGTIMLAGLGLLALGARLRRKGR